MSSPPRHPPIQDTSTPYITFPPTVDQIPPDQYRRHATFTRERNEVHPRAEMVTSAEGSSLGSGRFQSHDGYVPTPPPSVEEDAGTLHDAGMVYHSTSRVRTGSDSSGAHSPTQEGMTAEDLEQQLEECVPNTHLDPQAQRFRPRSANTMSSGPAAAASPRNVNDYSTPNVGCNTRPGQRNAGESLNGREPALKDLGTFEGRYDTYEKNGWPRDAVMSPEFLADAGFFYRGEGDSVVCVGCGQVLSGWERGDDPRKEHLKYFKFNCNI